MTGITIELPQKGLTFFQSLRELDQFLYDYENYWAWLSKAASKIGLYRNSKQPLLDAVGVSAVKKLRGDLSNLSEDEDLESDAVVSLVKTLEKRGNLIHLGTTLVKDIESYREEHGDEAAFCFCAYYLKLDISLQKATYLKSFFDAQLHYRGLLQSLDSYKSQLLELEQSSQSELSSIKKSRASLEQHSEKSKEKSDELYRRQSNAVKRLKRHSFKLLSFWKETARPKLTDYLNSEMEAIKRYYTEELAMKSSVEYWRDKGEQYSAQMRQWQTAYYLSAGILSGVLILSVFTIVATLLIVGQETVNDLRLRIESLGHLQYFVGFLVTLTLLTVLWVIRMFARLYLSSRDKMEDAQERVVMLQTYLSMIENDKNLNEKQSRDLILPVLFRPGNNSGSVDFPMPTKAVDSLYKASGQ